ncbi:MAG: hypothetical protein APF80_16065 [Alphaproteobacteria bacterium BRH_c36]|nr:MAG: hypothetical protein APF80_16065 [Alphaproteobacteria bacterium BRH_c36]
MRLMSPSVVMLRQATDGRGCKELSVGRTNGEQGGTALLFGRIVTGQAISLLQSHLEARETNVADDQ